MSVLLTKVLWFQLKDRHTEAIADNDYKDPVNITDGVAFDVAKAIDIQNNILSLTLRNPHELYVSEDNEIEFEEQDKFMIFAKHTDDGADVTAEKWSVATITQPETEHMLGLYYLVEFAIQHTSGGTLINTKCADKTYILFNKILAKAFTKKDALTVPQIIQKVIRFSSQTTHSDKKRGSGSDTGPYYDIDARFDSERTQAEIDAGITLITDVRRSTKEDGTTNSDTSFPQREIAKVWKPIYEWISELSQPEKTNSDSDLNSSLVYGRPFIYWIDEFNRFHWVYPTDTVADYIEIGKFMDETLSYDSSKTNDAEVFDVNLTKKVFDVTNMIIYNAGTDMNGTGIWGYEVNTTSNVKTLKMRVVTMVDIAEKWKNLDYGPDYCPATSRVGSPAGKPLYQYPNAGVYLEYDANPQTKNCVFWPTASFPNATFINNNTDYNNALREKCEDEGKNRAQTLIAGLSHARWKGSITVKGKIYSVGNLLEFTNESQGVYRQKVRIMEVRHNFDTSGWTTEISLEQDAVALVVG